jgi:hypothetical protein
MSFFKLSEGKKAALMFLKTVEVKGTDAMKQWVREKKWDKLRTVIEAVSSEGATIPSVDDLSSVGEMSSGLQDAHFFLALTDAMATDDAKDQLADALDTCCWDDVAETIMEKATQGQLNFSGGDLHQAYAPGDHRACVKLPDGLRDVVQGLITAGEVVGDFFSKTLPDFFENDFVNFFTQTIPDFFTGPFVDFFKDLGGWITEGFETVFEGFTGLFD